MSKEDFTGLRPQVVKHHTLFVSYVKWYGAELVAKVLRDGKGGKYKLKLMTNRKDRYQMLQLLGLDQSTPALGAAWKEVEL